MTFNIQGWIEISRWPDSGDDEHAWQGVLNLGSVVDVADALSERLFGLSRENVQRPHIDNAIAARRGVPPNPSPQVQDAIRQIRANEALYGEGEYGGFTYATWEEIRQCSFNEVSFEEQWCIPFGVSRLLEARCPASQIRFVVWFVW